MLVRGRQAETGENCRVITSEVIAVEGNITLQTLKNEQIFTHPSSVHKGHLCFSEKHQPTYSLSHSFSCICEGVGVWLVSMDLLALGNANGELSVGVIELFGTR